MFKKISINSLIQPDKSSITPFLSFYLFANLIAVEIIQNHASPSSDPSSPRGCDRALPPVTPCQIHHSFHIKAQIPPAHSLHRDSRLVHRQEPPPALLQVPVQSRPADAHRRK